MHVLIVEDDIRAARAMRDILESMDIRSISIAESEQEAVDDALCLHPDLIISDVRLSDGLGPCAVNRIRAALGPVKAFYVTGSPALARLHDPEALILVKPVQRSLLTATVLSHIAQYAFDRADAEGGAHTGLVKTCKQLVARQAADHSRKPG